MARFRAQKSRLAALLEGEDWRSHLEDIASRGMAATGPLMSFLVFEPLHRLRAAIALGCLTRALQAKEPDAARDIVRRLNWRLSEESGNIGWGVPEALGEILARTPPLARDFRNIFFSTILDLGFEDNFVDNPLLRRSCFFAIGRFLRACPVWAADARPLLVKGLRDEDPLCRGYAAWALGMLPPDLGEAPALRRLAEEGTDGACLLTDGDSLAEFSPAELALATLRGKPPFSGKDPS